MTVSKERQRELKQMYKEMKHPMGVFMIKNNENGKVFLEATNNLRGTINSYTFQLQLGSLRVKELQKEWKKYGEEAFAVEILEKLDYDEKEEKTDYGEELEILKMIWIEKLKNSGVTEFYPKK